MKTPSSSVAVLVRTLVPLVTFVLAAEAHGPAARAPDPPPGHWRLVALTPISAFGKAGADALAFAWNGRIEGTGRNSINVCNAYEWHLTPSGTSTIWRLREGCPANTDGRELRTSATWTALPVALVPGQTLRLAFSVTSGRLRGDFVDITAPRGETRTAVHDITVPPGGPGARWLPRILHEGQNHSGIDYRYEYVEGPVRTYPYPETPAPRAPDAPPPGPVVLPRPDCVDAGIRFASLSGQVETRRDLVLPGEKASELWGFAKMSTVICVGDHIKTGEDGSAIIYFADTHTTFLLGPEQEIIATVVEKKSVLRILAGRIWTNIETMARDGSMEIEMSQAVTGIKGTTLVLDERGSSSTVEVIEGEVLVTARSGQRATLVGGPMVTATSAGLGPVTAFAAAAESAFWEALRGTMTPGISRAPTSLARGKRATQSSTGWGGEAGRAVDGNTHGDYFAAQSVTSTSGAEAGWWEVDLGAVRKIDHIRLWNRTDCCAERLAGFRVIVSDTPLPAVPIAAGDAGTLWSYPVEGPVGESLRVEVGRSGRFVRVQLDAPQYLSLAEVEVFGR